MRILPFTLMFLASACDAPPPTASDTAPAAGGGTTPPPAAAPAAAGQPLAAQARAVRMEEKSALLNYAYSWPAEAAALPTLDARLRADARTSRQRAINAAEDDRQQRGTDFPFHAHELTKAWTVEGDAAGLLALRDEFYTYTGGAHGMSGFEFILWDRAADRDIAVRHLFADWPAARAELIRLFCPALNVAREGKRGAPVNPEDGMFNGCPELEDQVLIPSNVQDGAFTAIRVLIGPYEAGPYAEGSYDVPLRVTPRLVALLKPERRDVLAPPRPAAGDQPQ